MGYFESGSSSSYASQDQVIFCDPVSIQFTFPKSRSRDKSIWLLIVTQTAVCNNQDYSVVLGVPGEPPEHGILNQILL